MSRSIDHRLIISGGFPIRHHRGAQLYTGVGNGQTGFLLPYLQPALVGPPLRAPGPSRNGPNVKINRFCGKEFGPKSATERRGGPPRKRSPARCSTTLPGGTETLADAFQLQSSIRIPSARLHGEAPALQTRGRGRRRPAGAGCWPPGRTCAAQQTRLPVAVGIDCTEVLPAPRTALPSLREATNARIDPQTAS